MNYINPYIKITWEDNPENFTTEKLKRVKAYFQQKYDTRYVNIQTKANVSVDDLKLKSLQASDQILDRNFQRELMKDFIEENKFEVKWNMIERLDNTVNEEIDKRNEDGVKYNRWYIKNIKFNNFLSYGQDNEIDYTTFNGITVIESQPNKNFSGKTTLLDAILFLYFGTTTKTTTSEEIFNRFTDKDVVEVSGTTVIDGEDYIIDRKIFRKKSKTKGYTYTNKLEFYKINADGSVENLNGEQRRETEKFITGAIGTEEDFLMTIMTTGSNLDQLIESKPTARGQILSKFMGLETLKIKEEICKGIHSDWSKTLLSNTFNQTQLENDTVSYSDSIEESKNAIINLKETLVSLENDLKIKESNRDKLLSDKNNDVDQELIRTNPQSLNIEKAKVQQNIDKLKTVIDGIDVTEPSTYYYEDKHEELKEKINKIVVEGKLNAAKVEENTKLIKNLEEGEFCHTCKQPLKDVDHSDEIKQLHDAKIQLEENNKILRETLITLNKEEKEFKKIKEVFDTYEKNKILRTKNKLTLSEYELELLKIEGKLEKYETNKQKAAENKLIEEKLVVVKTQIQSITGEIRQGNSDVESHNNNIKVMTDKITTNNELIKKIKKEQELAHVFKIYLTIFGKNGIAKVIMKNMIPLLNQELHSLLSDSCYFSLELRVNQKNEIDFVMIDSETRVEKPLVSGSGYEKTISSLALRSVLTKISSLPKPNVIFMDEVFGKVADENLEMVGEFFKKIKSYFEHIILISHNPLIRNWSDNLIMVRKEDNISSIDHIKIKF